MVNRNSYVIGILLGIVIPAVLFGILLGLNYLAGILFHGSIMLSQHKMMFVSIALNILPMRYFFVKKEHENTAKGILIITLVLLLIVTVFL
jgi:hypothetical protein